MAVIWTLTDGKAGDALQCLGVAEAVPSRDRRAGRRDQGFSRPPLRPCHAVGTADPADLALLRDELAVSAPDIAIASGRRAVTYLRWLKKRSPLTFTVFLKDPRTGAGAADFIWLPLHDRLRGDNVLATLTSPHRQTPAVLAVARAAARPELLALARPRVAVLAGGPSKDIAFGEKDVARFVAALSRLAEGGAGLMVTPSRRTPAAMKQAMARALAGGGAWLWDGTGANPYAEMLALADAFVVTADSANMLSEAASTGKTIHVFMPEGVPAKIGRLVDELATYGAVVKFDGRLENRPYEPLDSTPLIARAILDRSRRPARP